MRVRVSGTRSTQRRSSIPWTPIDHHSDSALLQLSFSQPTQPDLHLPSNPQPVDFFRYLFDDTILEYISDETNMYGCQYT